MLILASQSPRRKELLQQIGVEFTCHSADIDESVLANESPYDYVERLAIAKAQVIADKYPNDTVLGSDTSVVIDNRILGKPINEDDSASMLALLSGRKHQVFTSIALVSPLGIMSQVVTTDVEFKVLSKQEIADYWLTGEPQDKAGSYAIQGLAGQFIKRIEGSYSAIVGLPLYETANMLKQAKINVNVGVGVVK